MLARLLTPLENAAETEAERRRALTAYLKKYLKKSNLEDEVDLPGWTEFLMDELTEL